MNFKFIFEELLIINFLVFSLHFALRIELADIYD